MMRPKSWRGLSLLSALVVVVGACGGKRGTGPTPGAPPEPAAGRPGNTPQFDAVKLYQQLGLLARGAPMPFLGSVAFLATATPDSTHVALALSLANEALTFGRENDRFHAGYTVSITLRDGATTVRQVDAHQDILVVSFKETSRIDQSVIYQELLTLKPGTYRMTISVRDDGSSRTGVEDVTLSVPALGAGTLATPVPFLRLTTRSRLDSIPRFITNPASTFIFGRDTTVSLYLEAYGAAGDSLPIHLAARTDKGRPLFTDSVMLTHAMGFHSGIVRVPVSRLGIGPTVISVWQTDHMADSTRIPVFIGFGEELPIATFEEMVNYLRWFTSPSKLVTLRDAPPESRPAVWAQFVKDNASMTGGNEALRDYFARLRKANTTFREEGTPGWLTDRGKVLLALGEPDQVFEQGMNTVGQRGRTQIWEYRNSNMQLTFYDQTGYGRWRLTHNSDLDFQTAWHARVQ